MDNNKIKNKIITISGEPVSGKGTTVKMLIEKLKQQGYTDEQIHLESTGEEFRKYFNSIVDFISNFDNKEKLKEISSREEIKVFLENKEYRDILTKTIADLKRNNVDLSRFTVEQANNRKDFSEIRKVVDYLIDNGIKEKGKEINKESHPDDEWIVESRMAFHNIPESFSIRLTTVANVAGERLFNDKTRGKEDSSYKSVDEAIEEREKRRLGENSRYMQIYGVDLTDENNYDLIIDTSYSSVEDIVNVILECSNCYYNNKEFSKKWASPKIFLPLQTERDTLGKSCSGYDIEKMIKEIKENGYYPDSPIEVLNVDGINYIYEGHHRNFAVAYLGGTLVPYEVIAKDDENIPGTSNTAKQRVQSLSTRELYGHEDLIRNKDKDFLYSKMFPEIFEKLQQEER